MSVETFQRGEFESTEDLLRDLLALAASGELKAVVVVGLTDEGVVTAGDGLDEGRFQLLGGLHHMANNVEAGIE